MLHKNHLLFTFLSVLLSCAVLYLHGSSFSLMLPAFKKEAPTLPTFSYSPLFPAMAAAPKTVPPAEATPTVVPPAQNYYAPTDAVATMTVSGVKAGAIQFKNETDYAIDPTLLRNEPLHLPDKTEQPYVLILHTHATEAYTPTAAMPYVASSDYRTRDTAT